MTIDLLMQKKELQFEDVAYLNSLQESVTAVNHIHWDGSIPFSDLWKFYQQKGEILYLPENYSDGTPIQENREIRTLDQLYALRDGLFSKYGIVDVFKVPTMAMQTAGDLKTMAIAHCLYLRSQNIAYAETRFAPWYHATEGQRGSSLSIDKVLGYSLEGFAQGKEQTGVIVKPIICINREVNPEDAIKITKAALHFADRGVVGIDLACYEPAFPPELFEKAFTMTFESSLRRTVHADEMVSEAEGKKNLWTAINLLRADGIGHGHHLYQDTNLIQLMVKNNIRLESNPISNLTCGFIKNVEDLHLDYLVKCGVKVTISPDDPAMWPNGDLAHNLYIVGKAYGDEFVETVLRNAVETAWGLSEEEKKLLQP